MRAGCGWRAGCRRRVAGETGEGADAAAGRCCWHSAAGQRRRAAAGARPCDRPDAASSTRHRPIRTRRSRAHALLPASWSTAARELARLRPHGQRGEHTLKATRSLEEFRRYRTVGGCFLVSAAWARRPSVSGAERHARVLARAPGKAARTGPETVPRAVPPARGRPRRAQARPRVCELKRSREVCARASLGDTAARTTRARTPELEVFGLDGEKALNAHRQRSPVLRENDRRSTDALLRVHSARTGPRVETLP